MGGKCAIVLGIVRTADIGSAVIFSSGHFTQP